ncbi:DEHA2F08910p [Debaryomyces hansenii CBS767]|uniref:DEHA2F08910p n=1 Tax=Debaryomyces hansenii (strain ATCC 36239 / CBS 767 / BCRC 21394 / JCM 1990 / NBRC 0083 / IGC 2968) TaxID=284592 RepID=Q6BM22_DEBHA|nr:DEHA2F08910p [Debaryomyces hansenii CBS767]CAG89090.2 DEHA2F08910p [Debaryomyces hansenii CBS767]|eukprot:XP_460749.2 DEHA2F08910p [Debaryomyces hansenii CBS767]
MRGRIPSTLAQNNAHPSLNQQNSTSTSKTKAKHLEFKYLYFKIQKLIHKRVVLSLKYEQLKSPGVHSTLMKPLASKIVEIASISNLSKKINRVINSLPTVSPYQTPRFGPQTNANYNHDVNGDSKLSINLVCILLLLRFEFTIQAENNLIKYDILNTKATICEILAIKMLREYKAYDRINLLFTNPMRDDHFQNKFPSRISSYNTLELAVLSKSKKFLSQPVIEQILDRFYDGELIVKRNNDLINESIVQSLLDVNSMFKNLEEQTSLLNDKSDNAVINYTFKKLSLHKITTRANIVPKYQSLVMNMKLIFFAALHFILILKQKHTKWYTDPSNTFMKITELLYWLLAFNFNFELFIKLRNINFKFLRKIIWTYADLILILLIDSAFFLRIFSLLNKVGTEDYHDAFSLISIVLLPRILSVFNNYEFFNMITQSLKKMLWKLIGLFFLFISLISGFYLTFISLAIDRNSYEIAFDMLKVFFGFTPAVWSNWDSYNNLGRAIQMGYLFLSQFIIATILAIVLSQVFSKVSLSNKEEFAYFKSTNLVVYFQTSDIFYENGFYGKSNRFTTVGILYMFMNLFKFPIILIIFIYELIVANINSKKGHNNLKQFTFLNKEQDYYQDQDLVNMDSIDDDTDVSLMLVKTRNNSMFQAVPGRKISSVDNVNHATSHLFNNLAPTKSIGNLRSASTDSFIIDEILSKKYGGTGNLIAQTPVHQGLELVKASNNEMSTKLSASQQSKWLTDRRSLMSMNNPTSNANFKATSGKKIKKRKKNVNNEIMTKLNKLETLVDMLVNQQHDQDETVHAFPQQLYDDQSIIQEVEENDSSSVIRGDTQDTNFGEIYRINEVSLDDMDSINMSHEEADAGEDDEVDTSTEVESDDTY